MELYLEALKHFIGHGDPGLSKYFFFGIEENGEISNDDSNRIDYYIKKYKEKLSNYFFVDCKDLYTSFPQFESSDFEKSRKSDIYNVYYNVYRNLEKNSSLDKDDFLKLLGTSDINVFIGNINFIPKKSSRFETLEFSANKFRNNLILDFIKEYIFNKPVIMIFFGKRENSKFLPNDWKDKEPIKTNNKSGRQIFFQQNKTNPNIFWTNHPNKSYGWLPKEYQNELANIIRTRLEILMI